ncbi:MAG TPA: hypothetical protein VK512_01130 [Xanthobacteraceae bacterium]|nr:hypothetical protein [Xanthobacteraceae bacterium]
MAHSEDFVGIHNPRLLFISVGDRAAFDLIERPARDAGENDDGNHVLVKTVEEGGVTVIFQHWIKHRGQTCTEQI